MDGSRQELAGIFGHPGVAAAYRHRPPYPDEVFALLDRLVTDEPRDVLDLGAGDGALARPLAARMRRVDAVDVSPVMVAAGREQPGGDRPNLRWVVGAAETCELRGPYALVTAGASLHWMAWRPLLARLAGVLTDHAYVAVVEHGPRDAPWHGAVLEVIVRHSRNPDFDPGFSVVDALSERGLLDVEGRAETAPVPFVQPVAEYVEYFHSTASLAREHMTEDEAAVFDRAIEDAVRPWAVDGVLSMSVVANVTWALPVTTKP